MDRVADLIMISLVVAAATGFACIAHWLVPMPLWGAGFIGAVCVVAAITILASIIDLDDEDLDDQERLNG